MADKKDNTTVTISPIALKRLNIIKNEKEKETLADTMDLILDDYERRKK